MLEIDEQNEKILDRQSHLRDTGDGVQEQLQEMQKKQLKIEEGNFQQMSWLMQKIQQFLPEKIEDTVASNESLTPRPQTSRDRTRSVNPPPVCNVGCDWHGIGNLDKAISLQLVNAERITDSCSVSFAMWT